HAGPTRARRAPPGGPRDGRSPAGPPSPTSERSPHGGARARAAAAPETLVAAWLDQRGPYGIVERMIQPASACHGSVRAIAKRSGTEARSDRPPQRLTAFGRRRVHRSHTGGAATKSSSTPGMTAGYLIATGQRLTAGGRSDARARTIRRLRTS